MAIRTVDTKIFDKITENSKEKKDTIKIKEDFNSMTQDEMEYLYDKAKEELKDFLIILMNLHETISNMFCGMDILSVEEATDFFCTMRMFAEDLIPAMLEGDHEKTYKYCDEEITEEELNEARIEFFEELYNKYLKR